ncbi:NAD(P)H-dependent oxidoreductase [Botrimarina sp.]|uniref:FMN-dependent NADH-azoreductase n=1 Tax=Botrimarina sp. TaxID=2795802 RepID=UPI0032EF85F2
MTILSIQASPRSDRSLSRKLSEVFISAWRSLRPADEFLTRDVGRNPPPHLTEEWIGAAFTPPQSRSAAQHEVLRVSDELVDEVLSADVIVIATPMYNYGMPSHLKSWIDQVIRIDRTFTFDLARGEQPIEPVQSGKSLVLLTASGEGHFAPGEANADRNHLDTHIEHALRLAGVSETHRVRIEFQEFGDQRHRSSVAAAHARARDLARRLAGDPSADTGA